MKNLLKKTAQTLLLTALTVGTLSAQDHVEKPGYVKNINEVSETIITKYELNNDEVVTIKTMTEEAQPILWDPSDKGQIDQDIIPSPVFIEKTIWIDNDNDTKYDREITLIYEKDNQMVDLNYVATPNGVVIDTEKSFLIMNEEGEYEVDSENVEDITILVEDLD